MHDGMSPGTVLVACGSVRYDTHRVVLLQRFLIARVTVVSDATTG